MDQLSFIQKLIVWTPPVLLAITLHEVAHGWMAKLCGDDTAKRLGRLSFNPLHHVDLFGTVILPGLLLAMGGFLFGWAKPVPVDWERLRQPRRDIALVAVAGPLANLLMALAWALLARLAVSVQIESITPPLAYMSMAGISINIVLAALNLIPLPPLDGGRIMTSLLPLPWSGYFAQLEPYGFWILMFLVASNLLSAVLEVPVKVLQQIFFAIAGL